MKPGSLRGAVGRLAVLGALAGSLLSRRVAVAVDDDMCVETWFGARATGELVSEAGTQAVPSPEVEYTVGTDSAELRLQFDFNQEVFWGVAVPIVTAGGETGLIPAEGEWTYHGTLCRQEELAEEVCEDAEGSMVISEVEECVGEDCETAFKLSIQGSTPSQRSFHFDVERKEYEESHLCRSSSRSEHGCVGFGPN